MLAAPPGVSDFKAARVSQAGADAKRILLARLHPVPGNNAFLFNHLQACIH